MKWLDHAPPGYRPTQGLRTRNIPFGAGIVEQLWINDDKTNWCWVRVPQVEDNAPLEGTGEYHDPS